MGYIIGDKGYEQDIVMRQGSTMSYSVILDNEDNTPVNLTGCTISSKLRKTLFDGVIYTINTSITDAINGKFSFGLTASETLLIPSGGTECDLSSQYHWNLDITYSNGEIRPLFYGKIYVIAAVQS